MVGLAEVIHNHLGGWAWFHTSSDEGIPLHLGERYEADSHMCPRRHCHCRCLVAGDRAPDLPFAYLNPNAPSPRARPAISGCGRVAAAPPSNPSCSSHGR